jgi:DNA-binding NtrC family response regulator
MFEMPVDALIVPVSFAAHAACAASSQAPRGKPVWLAIEEGGARRVLRRLVPGESVVVGSSAACDVVLRGDDAICPRHVRFEHRGQGILVESLDGNAGLYVGAATLFRAELVPDTRLTLGETVLHLALDADDDGAVDEPPLRGLVGGSAPMRRLAAKVRRMAPLALPALVRGESGAGKELVARALHDESPRARGPFVALNAAAITRELAESELFGHERGAFTGAQRERRGAFREAHGGTLFLDEIGALPAEIQPKLLRAVEEGAVRPVGAEKLHRVDVRLVVATCEPLEDMVATRRFRQDLYERLAACVVTVPALRERPSDVPLLAAHLLQGAGLSACTPTARALALLGELPMPGNVRELRNVLVQAALKSGGPIDVEHVLAVLAERRAPLRRRVDPHAAVRLLEETGGNVSAAARAASLPRSTLRSMLRSAEKRRDKYAESAAL